MAKPSVDGLEEQLGDSLRFTHVNLGDEEGMALAADYNIRVVPTFLVLSPDGEVLYRKSGGFPDQAQIEAELARFQ